LAALPGHQLESVRLLQQRPGHRTRWVCRSGPCGQAGIARSGAYNRTLTPFGFQNEQRTFWDVPQIYSRMSPFNHANLIKEPVLLIHGSWDYVVPVSQSVEMNRALRQAGRDVTYVEFEGADHNFYDRNGTRLLIEVGNFLAVHLPTPRNPSP